MENRVKGNLLAFSFLVCLFFSATAQEALNLTMTTKDIARPAGKPLDGQLPRYVLMLVLFERGQTFREPEITTFHVYDPAHPEQGFKKVFTGPEEQYCRFLTPLFGGSGVVVGELDPKEKPAGRKMFWFDLLSGEIGGMIARNTMRERIRGTEIVCEVPPEGESARTGSQIIRYDLSKNKLIRYDIQLWNIIPADENCIMALTDLKGGRKIIKINTLNSQNEILGDTPPYFKKDHDYYEDEATGIYPAGKDCKDGVYGIHDFSLEYMPRGGKWISVIQDVHIVKTFGGRREHLPVVYVGDGRFAVAKTVKDSVEKSKKEARGGWDIPQAQSVTMLIDGRTGKVLKESEPEIYDHNPCARVPDNWWSEDMKPQPQHGEDEAGGNNMFKWDKDTKEIRYGREKKTALAKDEKCRLSGDGRYLLIFKQQTEGYKAPSKMTLRIIDGVAETDISYDVNSDSKQIYVSIASWLMLCPDKPDEKSMGSFMGSGFDYFREPIGNW